MEGTKEERIKQLLEILHNLQKEMDELKKEVEEDHIRQLERIEKKHQEEMERITKKYQERKENREKELREHIKRCNEFREKYERDDFGSIQDSRSNNYQNDGGYNDSKERVSEKPIFDEEIIQNRLAEDAAFDGIDAWYW